MPKFTVDTGEALITEFLPAWKAGFASNNHAKTCAHLFSEKIMMDWSDGIKGEKTKAEFFNHIASTWGLLASNFLYKPNFVFDTTNSKVITFGHLVLNIDGKMGIPNLVEVNFCNIIGYDDAGKINSWTAHWDNSSAPLLEALGKVSAAFAAAK